MCKELAIVLCFLALEQPALWAQAAPGADDRFLEAYQLWNAGERLEREGNKSGAMQSYQAAEKELVAMKSAFPDWKPEIVVHRLLMIEQALARLGQTGGTNQPPKAIPLTDQEQIRLLQLDGKAKDEVIAGIAARAKRQTEARALAETEQKKAEKAAGSLQTERDTLRTDMERLQAENSRLKKGVPSPQTGGSKGAGDMAGLEAENARLKTELEAARQQVETLKREGSKKSAEIVALKSQLSSLQEDIVKLRQQNAAFEAQVADMTVKLKKLNEQLENTQAVADSKLVEENKALRNIIIRHLRQQERLRQSKEIVIAEMKRMQGASQVLMENLEDMTSGKVWVTVDEESLFAEPELKTILALSGPLTGSVVTLSATQDSTSQKASPGVQRRTMGKSPLSESKPVPSPSSSVDKVPQPSGSPPQQLAQTPAPPQAAAAAPPAPPPQPTQQAQASAKEPVKAPPPKAAPPSPPKAVTGKKGAVEQTLLVQANAALENGNTTVAEQKLQDVLRANPKNTAALTSLAGIKLNKQQNDEADVLLQKCLVYDPDNGNVLYLLGVSAFRQSKLAEAIDYFEKTARRQKDNAKAHHYLGIIATQMKNRARAEAEFKNALAIDPNNADAHFNLSVVYATSDMPDLDKAREHYREATSRGAPRNSALEKLLYPPDLPASPDARGTAGAPAASR